MTSPTSSTSPPSTPSTPWTTALLAGLVLSHDGSEIDRECAPRPYLTAATRTGIPVTDVAPDDHPHHLGVSFALPDVNGTTFWGGRTYRRGVGSVMLDNHGRQQILAQDIDDDRLRQTLRWVDRDGAPLLDERRTIEARSTPDDEGFDLVWRSELTAAYGDVSFGSPQTNGRDGAFYGGIFSRTPFAGARVRTADGDGIETAHGSRSPWLAIDETDAAGHPTGTHLIAVTTSQMPWFVRSEGYVGFCPAFAVDSRRVLAAGATLRADLAVAVRVSRGSQGSAARAEASDPAALAARLRDALERSAPRSA